MDKQIVYVLSTNYAGSHFLALQLGSHSRCASIGELHHFRRNDTRFKACFLCEIDDKCPIFTGINQEPISRYYERIFENLAVYDSSISTVIDNSKKVRWASRFVEMPGFTQKYIHIIRDPRALVRRWMLTFDTPSVKRKMRVKTARRCWRNALDILTGDEPNIYIWHWLYQNMQITDFLNRNRLNVRLVTYHDLVFKTDEVLDDLMKWLGYAYEPSQKEYWNFTHHGSVKPQYMKAPENSDKLFDQRWKTFLGEETQSKIFHHPKVNRYLDSLGLAFDPDKGLLGRWSGAQARPGSM
jgi:hypothetical protein